MADARHGALHLPRQSGPDDVSHRTGQKLRLLRSAAGLSLDDLSRRAGVSRAMLSQIENGKSSPTITVLSKIAAPLNTACGALIAEQDGARVSIVRCADSVTTTRAHEGTAVRRLTPDRGLPRLTACPQRCHQRQAGGGEGGEGSADDADGKAERTCLPEDLA